MKEKLQVIVLLVLLHFSKTFLRIINGNMVTVVTSLLQKFHRIQLHAHVTCTQATAQKRPTHLCYWLP